MFAVVPAAGLSSRMGSSRPAGSAGESSPTNSKVFLPLLDNGSSVLRLTIRSIVLSDVCRGIVVLTRAGDEAEAATLLQEEAPGLECHALPGGETRQDSVRIGLAAVPAEVEFVLVHDGARPLCPPEKIREVAAAARDSGAAMLALPVKPSLKEVGADKRVSRTVPRHNIWEAQTPQVFRSDILRHAHDEALRDNFLGTDESELVERLAIPVRVVPGDERNLKITTPTDLQLAGVLAASLFK